jgi:protein TonB
MPHTKLSEATGDTRVAAKRDLAVRRTLVPANAQIGRAASQTLDVGGAAAQQNLFKLDEALLDKAFADDARKPVDWLISLGVHLAVVAVVMLIPLFVTQAIDLGQFRYTYLVAPSLGAPSVPAPPPPPAAAHPQQAPRPRNLTTQLIAPVAIPKAIEMPRIAEEPPSEEAIGVPGGVVGGVPGGQIGGVLGGTLGGEGLSVPPPPIPILTPAPASVPSGPLRVGGQVKAPRVISAPQPEYPMLAKQARLQGVVQIEAVIDEHGNVVQMKAVSGSGLLIPAAMRAVAQWKYEPTYLNGAPYPVSLTVEVTFHM